jgi:transcriptional regulator with XRE-family HTH domain
MKTTAGDEKRTDLRMITRRMLRERKWTQQRLADEIGTTRQQVCNWLNGAKGLPYDNTERLLWLLGIRY